MTIAKAPKKDVSHKRPAPKKPRRISRMRRPEELSLEQWQVALRRQFGQEQNFRLRNIGTEPIFSEFLVTNPRTKGEYRVAIRGLGLGDNYCSCPDFAVNTLGTCKHIECTLARLQHKHGGGKALQEGFHPDYSEVYLRYGAKREVIFRPGAHCPGVLATLAGRYFTKNGLLRPNGYMHFEKFLKGASAIDHDLRCYEDTLGFIAELRDTVLLQKRIDKAFPRGAESAAFRHLLKASLYAYQRKGAWFAARTGRSLIADDMGLGKTVQAIAAAEILVQTMGIERVLIVCPTSLKHQWKQEIEKFTDRSAVVVEGLLEKRRTLYAADALFKIVNYDVIPHDVDTINAWRPDLIILDEAQRIKNWKTRRAQSVKRLDSPYALVMTGTPLENRLEELHSIVEFVDRFRLGPMFRFLSEHQHIDENGKVVGYHGLTRISKSLESILLRRTKNEVLMELPERLDKNYFVPMTGPQMEIHQENHEIVVRIAARWRRYHFLSEADQRRLMIALQYMRMSCNSTYLIDTRTDHGVKADELMTVLHEIFERPDAKVVVFSQWLRTHELLQSRLADAGYAYTLFHGGIPSRKRKELITQFKSEPDRRIFLSTDAGGVGLNLQNASAVINMDLPWNPAVLEQRIGRVHRLGQHQPVRVINFVAQGTIEHGMLSVLSFKKSLFSGVLDNGKDEVFLGGTRLNRFMETVEKATQAVPESMPQQCDTPPDIGDTGQEAAAGKETLPQTWQDLLTTGLSFLEKLDRTLHSKGPQETGRPSKTELPINIETDPKTGKAFMRVPVPTKDALQKVADLLSNFVKQMQS